MLLLAFAGMMPAHANDLEIGKPAPPLVLHALNGQTISTGDLRGRVVIVTFWATWCEPCRKELPMLSDFAKRHADSVRILGFSLDDAEDIERVRKVAGSLEFPVGLLGSQWAGGYGRIWRIPVSFVIDRDGRLIYDGWTSSGTAWNPEALERIVTPLLSPGTDSQDSITGTRGASAQSSS